mmetsp:Transcript_38285/g.63362  ORF Transcript_38285/g.63362 Transcript_38285/m.63362 type:complete len:118 (+) Transcript_38285:44-397(+)|eukprot:CAMPEP_0119311180 /NCGR_PEP_ID=MMETSP1333-20130426/21958_1 /TAXON_ID=418940 /ORGANISM="Scyphosphaera apsteinii, Strain RCC1455" /LENGTH=117 /DNA_ID=CAMNT_0007315507 /DNA_START=44 /DNA_END=397 /DNA_ORIENTATION=+
MAGNGSELACVYAALILHDDGLEVSAENISSLLKAAQVETEAYWPTLFAKLCKGKDIGSMLSAGGGGGGAIAVSGGGGDVAGAAAGGDAAAPAEEKKKEPEPEPEEEEEEMGFDLFD